MKTKLFTFLTFLLLISIAEVQAQQGPPQKKTPQKGTKAYDNTRLLAIYSEDFGPAKLYGFKDSITGEIVIPAGYIAVEPFTENLAMVANSKAGFINKVGNMVIPMTYDYAESFSEGLAYVEKDNKSGFIDKTGALVIPLIYDHAGTFKEGLAWVKNGEKFGFINQKGEIVIPIEFNSCGSRFNEGLIWLNKGGKWGYMDKSGQTIIPFLYDDAVGFKDGKAAVKLNGETFLIDTKGVRIQ
jgi:hypothetical protein